MKILIKTSFFLVILLLGSCKEGSCGSSLPRGLEMYSSHLAGEIGDTLSVNTLSPSTIQLTKKFGEGTLKTEGDFPLESSTAIKYETVKKKNFTLEIRIPANSSLASFTANGESAKTQTNERGFVELTLLKEQIFL